MLDGRLIKPQAQVVSLGPSRFRGPYTSTASRRWNCHRCSAKVGRGTPKNCSEVKVDSAVRSTSACGVSLPFAKGGLGLQVRDLQRRRAPECPSFQDLGIFRAHSSMIIASLGKPQAVDSQASRSNPARLDTRPTPKRVSSFGFMTSTCPKHGRLGELGGFNTTMYWAL